MAKTPKASVIVPARDAAATLPRALEALARQELEGGFEAIVVDDGSSDATPEVVERANGARLLRQPSLGPAEARNRGGAAAATDVLVFMDADCFPTPGWLSAGLAALGEADLVQGAVLPDPAADIGPFDRSLWVLREVGLYESANLFVRRELFERLGGFSEWIEPVVGKAIAEDVLFGWRARWDGARVRFSEEALVHHAVFPRGGWEYAAERVRRVHFPEMAARIPEIRDTFLFARYFLDRRTAAFDAALAGALAAARMRSPLPLLLAAPYAWMAAGRARRWGRRSAPRIAAVHALADVVSFQALVRGSLRAGTPVL
jgi:glycosyltransferase involved in cell wall biosynthesis